MWYLRVNESTIVMIETTRETLCLTIADGPQPSARILEYLELLAIYKYGEPEDPVKYGIVVSRRKEGGFRYRIGRMCGNYVKKDWAFEVDAHGYLVGERINLPNIRQIITLLPERIHPTAPAVRVESLNFRGPEEVVEIPCYTVL